MRCRAVARDEHEERAEQERVARLNELKATAEARKQCMINLDEEATRKVKKSEMELEVRSERCLRNVSSSM